MQARIVNCIPAIARNSCFQLEQLEIVLSSTQAINAGEMETRHQSRHLAKRLIC